MTATREDTVQPVKDHRQPPLARWPLHAVLELGALPTAPGCARAWTRQLAWEWRLTPLADSAGLVVSELVTNAVLASRHLDRSAIWLSLVSDRDQLVVLVRDLDPGAPEARHASHDDESGRGLMLVEAVSDRFGWFRPQDGMPGKVVWAVIQAELQQMQQSAAPVTQAELRQRLQVARDADLVAARRNICAITSSRERATGKPDSADCPFRVI
jgi:anti-sigma regulatory factor (Ser/Thr protein kinase)